jgi:hypothetical protein
MAGPHTCCDGKSTGFAGWPVEAIGQNVEQGRRQSRALTFGRPKILIRLHFLPWILPDTGKSRV